MITSLRQMLEGWNWQLYMMCSTVWSVSTVSLPVLMMIGKMIGVHSVVRRPWLLHFEWNIGKTHAYGIVFLYTDISKMAYDCYYHFISAIYRWEIWLLFQFWYSNFLCISNRMPWFWYIEITGPESCLNNLELW